MQIHDKPHLSLIWQQRYIFHFYDNTTKELFVRLGSSPERMFQVANNMTTAEYRKKVEDIEAIPGRFIAVADARALAENFFRELDIPTPNNFDHYFKPSSQIWSEASFYRMMNRLIDTIEIEDELKTNHPRTR